MPSRGACSLPPRWLGADDPAAERLHTGQQLTDAEGLGHIVVGTDGQAADLILLLPLGTQDNDADLLVGAADGLAEREAIHARQHHVQDGRVTARALLQKRQGRFGAVRLHSLHPGQTQVQRYHLANAGLIFHYQNLDHLSFLRFYPVCLMRKARHVTKNHF